MVLRYLGSILPLHCKDRDRSTAPATTAGLQNRGSHPLWGYLVLDESGRKVRPPRMVLVKVAEWPDWGSRPSSGCRTYMRPPRPLEDMTEYLTPANVLVTRKARKYARTC